MYFLKLILNLLVVALFVSCSDEIDTHPKAQLHTHRPDDYVVAINTSRSAFNILDKDSILFSRASGFKREVRSVNDYFTVEKDVSTNVTVVLPEYSPHIWLGNVLYRSSVADCTYKPISGIKKPIMASLSLMGATSSVINNPSYSTYTSYIKQQIPHSSFKQNDEFFFSIDQFTSYNELKSTFGSNVNTNFLFWGSSSSNSGSEHQISKATGLYLKFWQSSFTAVMDAPSIPYANVPTTLIDSAVYINSITYGRFGLLTMETNEEANTAKRMLQESFHTLCTKGSSYISSEERNFLNRCDFKLYLIGGNGATSVQSFNGFTGFVDHVTKGHFSKEQPGLPIFCSFANVADNSLAKIKFKYTIRREPLYVEIINHYKDFLYHHTHEYSINFYANRSKVPMIAHPKVKFRFKFDTKVEDNRKGNKVLAAPKDTTYIREYSNTKYGTSMPLFTYSPYHAKPHYSGSKYGVEADGADWEVYTSVKLLDSPDYVLLDFISIPMKNK